MGYPLTPPAAPFHELGLSEMGLSRRRFRHLDVKSVGSLDEHQIRPGRIRTLELGLVAGRLQRVAELI